MEYKLVYESSNMEINFIFIFIALLAIIIIVYYIFRIEIQKKIISTIIIFFISFSIYGIYKKAQSSEFIQESIRLHNHEVVEGKIEKFHIMPLFGHDLESFEVNDKFFEIVYTGNYPNTKTLYYTLTKNRKGPITHNGQKVKIYYLNINDENKIIKMWVVGK